VTGTSQVGNPGEPDELALLAAGFPAFRLWRETVHDRTRYIARGISLGTRPHTVITDDLDELRTALAADKQDTADSHGPQRCGRSGPKR
jgi:hypothetical protein